MVFRLRQPKADLSIELDEGTFRLGQAITGRITLLPGESFQMRGGEVEFLCTETYYVRVRRTTRMGSAETNEAAATVIREYSQTIFDGLEIANLMPLVGNIDFTIPSNAPSTVKGVVANIAWRMKVTVDVARARDISQEIDLVILPIPGEIADRAQPSEETAPAVTQQSECDLNLSLAALRVSMGENVGGVFRLFSETRLCPGNSPSGIDARGKGGNQFARPECRLAGLPNIRGNKHS